MGLILGLSIIFVIGFFLIIYPLYTPLDVETIRKVSEIYPEPIHLIFHWITDDEIQVGKLITLDVKVKGLQYFQNSTLKKVEIVFNERQINYWYDKDDPRQNKFEQADQITLKPNWNYNVFESNKINLRFIVPENISIQFCDYNIEPSCHTIENIIQPAPYDLASQIDSNRIIITLSLIIASLSFIVVWSRIRGRNT